MPDDTVVLGKLDLFILIHGCWGGLQARVEAAGGQILFWNGVRVMGVLAVSRAIGDHCLRPYVIAQPEVCTSPVSYPSFLPHAHWRKAPAAAYLHDRIFTCDVFSRGGGAVCQLGVCPDDQYLTGTPFSVVPCITSRYCPACQQEAAGTAPVVALLTSLCIRPADLKIMRTLVCSSDVTLT